MHVSKLSFLTRASSFFKSCLDANLLFQNWWIFYFDFVVSLLMLKKNVVFNSKFIFDKSFIYKLKHGVKFYADAGEWDGLIIQEIWSKKVYTQNFLTIKKKDTVVEIGGHKGYFTTYASLMAKKGKIIVFEPEPNNFATLIKNINLNKRKNIHPFQLGISGSKGFKKFFIPEKGSSGATLLPAVYKNMDDIFSFRAKYITLADVFTLAEIKKINFLKMDCEGAEYEILLYASKKTLSLIDKISFEYHQVANQKVDVLIEYLTKNNFETKIYKQSNVIGILCAKRRA